jgi:hypothetical protein
MVGQLGHLEQRCDDCRALLDFGFGFLAIIP